MKVFLGDLVHDWEKVSLWTFPLNVGYIGAYAKKHIPENVEVRLFKRPELMIKAIREEAPDVIGLAHYVWNTNLNKLVFNIAKAHNPKILTVSGGPIFTNINVTQKDVNSFFKATPNCDAHIFNQGERGFAELLKALLKSGGDLDTLRSTTVPGCLVNDLRKNKAVHIGEALDIIRDLDEIPSPYLSGMLDEFFAEPFVPIIETNRSCPYRCTFCAWGIGTGKLARFGDERVFSEIEYISKRCTQSMNMFIGDANFSVLERDADIAKKLKACNEEYGYPGHVSVQWNKTRPDRVYRVAKELGGMCEVGASMQTLNPDVLAAIKRRNLPLSDVIKLTDQLKSDGLDLSLFSELIVGLPNETWKSHIDANRQLIDLGAEVFNYNLHLLPGTEMNTVDSRNAYSLKTGWRLHDNAFGIYDGTTVFEGQEVVLSSNSMDFDELRSFRFIHFLIQFMWSRKWYYDYLRLFQQHEVNPVDLIVCIASAFKKNPGEMGDLYARFCADHDLENFSAFEDLAGYWGEDANLERLRTGAYGKLNYLYTYEIILGYYEAFNAFLYEVSVHAVDEFEIQNPKILLDQVREILNFNQELRIELTGQFDRVVDSKQLSYSYDILSWRDCGYQGQLARISTSDRFDYEFYLPKRQRLKLEKQLSQFKTNDINLMLRKMSEYMSADDFFYRVRPGSTEELDAET